MFSIKSLSTILAVTGILAAGNAQAVDITLDPSATYLRTSEYTGWGVPHNAFAYSLSSLGFSAGDTITLTRFGEYMSTYAEWNGTDTSSSLLGVFSSTNTLLGAINPGADSSTLMITPLVRVPDAIATSLPAVVSKASYHGLLPSDPLSTLTSDIAEDFSISKTGTTVVIPVGAQYIFFSANDNLFGDNTDPNHNYGVSLNLAAVPEPGQYAMLISGLLLTGWMARRRTHQA